MNCPLQPSLPTVIGDFDALYLGSETYCLTLRGTKYRTGPPSILYLTLPIPHRLLKAELKHTDNADPPEDSVDSWTYFIRRLGIGNLYNVLRSGSGIVASDILETFDDSFVSGSTIYQLSCLQTTGTDRIWPTLYIESL